ncbi:MAG UNVERIFIED_CONTAM: hypothetical protein LVR18_39135 [Planctomycetaceae bacterium]
MAEHGNATQLTAAMLQLGADVRLREQLGAAGRARCSQIFRHEFMTDRIREVYANVLAKRYTS